MTELKNASMLPSYSDSNNVLVINLHNDDIKAHGLYSYNQE